MLFNTNFDLIFGIGEACSCSSALRYFDLQHVSYPMDWLFGTDFAGRIDIVLDEFNRFIEKQDLSKSYMERSINCTAYHNSYNDITFNHDFLSSIPFDDAYPDVRKKYDRRIARLMHDINNANSILVVYLEAPTTDHPAPDIHACAKYFEKLQNKYPNKRVCLLYLTNSHERKITKISDTVIFVQWYYKKENDKDYIVKNKKLAPVLRRVWLKKLKLKSIIRKKLINLIPIKSIRHKLKDKYHIRHNR